MGQFKTLSLVGIAVSILIAFFLSSTVIPIPLLGLSSLFRSALIQESSEKHWDHFYHLGGNGPWIQKENTRFGTYDRDGKPPQGCVVDQVHVVRNFLSASPRTEWICSPTRIRRDPLNCFQSGREMAYAEP